jgi:hypothetical protein
MTARIGRIIPIPQQPAVSETDGGGRFTKTLQDAARRMDKAGVPPRSMRELKNKEFTGESKVPNELLKAPFEVINGRASNKYVMLGRDEPLYTKEGRELLRRLGQNNPGAARGG